MTTDSVPAALRTLVSAWITNGRSTQPAISWHRERWLEDFPEHREMLLALPRKLDRAAVRAACSDAAQDARTAEVAFLSVMVWGYGDVGYGRHRTREILTNTPGAGERLARVVGTLGRVGAKAAYRRLANHDDSRLAGLGPSFGTKFLYFCQPRPARTTALILDTLVAEWLGQEADLDLDPGSWSEPTYGTYLDRMHQWGDALGCAPDELEACVFRASATEQGGQWGISDP